MSEIIDIARKSCECAIWYPETKDAEWTKSELHEKFREVDLLAVPITTKLLREPNRARDVEIPFAMERHIPILFLLVEKGCENDFAKQFGDIQYLSPLSKNSDGLSYNDMAEDFLKSTLAGTELRRRVRSAFDAHSFLSYRKKDRAHALRLMERIHENRELYSLAIWYDDFLTPGEDFNETILSEIESSDLFLLAVTPNVTEAGNYITKQEYPKAKEVGCNILPIEILSTEREGLLAAYPEIPNLVDANDNDLLRSALLDSLNGKIDPKNVMTAEKSCLLGIAYLHGINVEKNSNLAIFLLENAARGGSCEAIDTLVRIYQNGHGAIQNRDTAIEWQTKLVEIYGKKYRKSPCEQTVYTYLWELNYLGSLLCKEGRNEDSEKILKQAVHEIKLATEAYDGVRLQHLLTRAYYNLGDVLANKKDVSARSFYLLALRNSENTHEEKSECLFCSNIAFSLGNFLYDIEEKVESLTYYQMAVEYREQQFTNESTVSEWEILQNYYNTLSERTENTVGPDEAIRILDKAEKTFLAKCEDDCILLKRFCYYEILRFKAQILNKSGNKTRSEKYYLRLIQEVDESCKDIKTMCDWLFICRTYRTVADFYISRGEVEMAGKYLVDSFKKPFEVIAKSPLLDGSEHYFVMWNAFEIASLDAYAPCLDAIDELCRLGIEFCEMVEKSRTDVCFKSTMAIGYTNRARIRTRLNDHSGALECIKRAYNLTEDELAEASEPIEWLNRATYLKWHALGFENVGDLNSAATMLELSLHAMEQFVKDEPYAKRESELAYTCTLLAEYYIRLEQFEKAEPQLLRAYRSIFNGEESERVNQRAIYYGGKLLELYGEWGRFDNGTQYVSEHEKIIDILERECNSSESMQGITDKISAVFDGYGNLINFFLRSKDYTVAKQYSDRAITLLKKQSAMYTVAPIKLRALYENHGNACLEVGEYEEGREAFLKLSQILLDFIKTSDMERYDCVNLAKTYARLSELLRRAGDEKESLAYAEECMQILEQTASETHTHYAYQTWLEHIVILGERIGYRINHSLLADARAMAYNLYTDNPENPKHKRLYILSLEIKM